MLEGERLMRRDVVVLDVRPAEEYLPHFEARREMSLATIRPGFRSDFVCDTVIGRGAPHASTRSC